MPSSRQGAIHLFRFAGVDVYLHWLWFVVALYEINSRSHAYSSPLWNVLEYLALFAIVLLHEYGHALACKQTGGTANQIMLWPLGGIAYVNPPPRAAANLWSIAAGPLVNVLLVFVFKGLGIWTRAIDLQHTTPDLFALLRTVAYINFGLLLFNLLPIYPLDGGQIVRSLLWFIFGRARSLTIAAVLGLFGVAGLIALAIKFRDTWFAILSVFIVINCWNGLKSARALGKVEKLPSRMGYACPSCQKPPRIGPLWRCGACTTTFDTFEAQAQCPTCGMRFQQTRCLECGAQHGIEEWARTVPALFQSAGAN
jgi:Zn-dependent protease